MTWLDEETLDSVELLERYDGSESLRALASAGAQVRAAMTLGHEAGVERVAAGERPRAVVVAALGGSAVVGDALTVLAEATSPVPVASRRSAPLPGWVGPLDLVIAISLSGRAAGPTAVAAEAARRGCSLLTVGAPDSPLGDITLRARGVHVGVLGERASSRTSLWGMLTPVLMAAHALGIANAPDAELAAMADVLDERAEACRVASDTCVNPAKLLALSLSECVPVVLGQGPVSGVAARRAAAMLSRTARVPAMCGELPDRASDLVATLDGPFTAGGGDGTLAGSGRAGSAPRGIFADPFLDGPAQASLGVLALRDHEPEGDSRLRPAWQDSQLLMEAVLSTAREAGAAVLEVPAPDRGGLAQLAHQVQQTDFAAAYLALGRGLDPIVSRHVADLRDRTRR